MESLYNELDNQDAEDLEEANGASVAQLREELNKPCAFNKEDQVMSKYDITVGPSVKVKKSNDSANTEIAQPKKRKLDEISNTSAVTEKRKEDI